MASGLKTSDDIHLLSDTCPVNDSFTLILIDAKGGVIMTPKPQPPVRLLTRANENRCQHCPPERVCAWACVQGTSLPDRVVGAVLEQSPQLGARTLSDRARR